MDVENVQKKPQSIENLHLRCIYCHFDLMCYKNLCLWENIKQRIYYFNRTTCISVEINHKKHWKTKTMFREIHEQTSLNISCNSTPNSLTFQSHKWPREKFSLQYQYNIKQVGDENREEYKLWDYLLIQHQILWTNIIRIVWQIVWRITN